MRWLAALLVACSGPAPAPTTPPPAPAVSSITPPTDAGAPPSDLQRCGDGDDGACLRIEATTGPRGTVTGEVLASFAAYAKTTAAAGQVEDCVTGDGMACGKIADAYEAAGGDANLAVARRFHRIACVQSYWFSCNNLEVIHHDKLGLEVSKRRFVRDCKRTGTGDACFWAGVHTADLEQSKAFLWKSCEAGYGTGCYSFATRSKLHQTAPESYVRMLERACRQRSADACQELATPPKDLAASCQAGDHAACAIQRHHKRKR